MEYGNITVCIPTLNEEDGIGDVIESFRDRGIENITVIDGGSTDSTTNIAKKKGANVIEQKESGGKGAAVRQCIEYIDTEIIVFVDADKTYEAAHIEKLTEPIIRNEADHVIANRFSKIQNGAMSYLHRFGNRIINIIFWSVHGKNVKDLLSGYRAINTSKFKDINLTCNGFGIETEMTAASVRNNHEIRTVESTYYNRSGESELRSFVDGSKIMKTIFETRLKF